MSCLFCCGPKKKGPEAKAQPATDVSPHVQPSTVQQPIISQAPQAPERTYLLPEIPAGQKARKCLVLDLDETLVHSSFKPIDNADFKIEIELEGTIHKVFVRKRPFVDEFLKAVAVKYEVVIFTASLAKYADPLLDILDKERVVSTRLFREACVQHYGNYVKDLSHLGRALESVIIIDNSPFSYMFQPDNAIPITSWFNDKNDRQLLELLPFLDSLVDAPDVSAVLARKDFSFLNQSYEPDSPDENSGNRSSANNGSRNSGGNSSNGNPLIWNVNQANAAAAAGRGDEDDE